MQTSLLKLKAAVAREGFPEEFAALLHSRFICRRISSFLHSSCAIFRSRQVCNGTLQAAAACKGFPELFAAKQLKLFPQQNLHEPAAAACCDLQTCLQCGACCKKLRLQAGLPRGIRSLLHSPAGAAVLLRAFCRGRRPAVGRIVATLCGNAHRGQTLPILRQLCTPDYSSVCTLSRISLSITRI